ncbi:MAG: DUF2189 domain-containing protein [Betaproteobacteria bacterium]|nr:DUF2189 domain-containing protein [Betaproteobacteria bacterium]PWB57171.1 MAG: hypothetical protein C3F16_16070 [Betaproteobacteria bacterium]
MPQPDSPAEIAPPRVIVIPVTRPLAWLADGWRDLRYAPGVSLMHGLLVAVGGWVIAALSMLWVPLLPGAFSGFVLVAPILATGLYEMSRCRERGRPGDMACAFDAWRRGTRPLIWLGLGLTIAGTAWVLVSAVLVALIVTAPITGWEAFIRHVILSQGSNLFPVWMGLGALGASLVFAATVVSAPLLLDRDTDLWTAISTSVRVVAENPLAMAFWATLIMLATALSMATAMLGFVISIPVIGHATWHAYRETVDAGELPARE